MSLLYCTACRPQPWLSFRLCPCRFRRTHKGVDALKFGGDILSPSISLLVSPPLAIFARGLSGSPLLGLIRNFTSSAPFSVRYPGISPSGYVISTLKTLPCIPRSARLDSIAFSKPMASSALISCISLANFTALLSSNSAVAASSSSFLGGVLQVKSSSSAFALKFSISSYRGTVLSLYRADFVYAFFDAFELCGVETAVFKLVL